MTAAPSWLPDLAGRTVVLVGAGPSALDEPLAPYRPRAAFVTVNNSVFLAPWAVIAYGCDARWWRHAGGLEWFRGVKVSQDRELAASPFDIRLIDSVRGLPCQDQFQRRRDRIIWGGHGGAQALNLIAHAGPPRKICLVGFDMHLNGGDHWHADHPWPLPQKEANFARHRRVMDDIASDLERLGVDVVNCSRGSALRSYRFSTLAEEL